MNIDAALKEGYSVAEVNQEAARRVGFNYKGALEAGYSDDEINQELRKRVTTNKRDFDPSLALKSSFAEAGNVADTALSTLAGSAAALFGDTKAALDIQEGIKERKQTRRQWANPEQKELSFGEKLLGAGATLPMQVVSAGMSPATTVDEALSAGESSTQALKAGAIDAVGNLAGMLPFVGPAGTGLVKPMLSGGAINAAQDYATKAAIQGVMETKAGKAKFEPSIEDAAVSGMVGAGLGAVHGFSNKKKPPLGTKPSSDVETGKQLLAEKKAVTEAPKQDTQQEVKNLTALEDENRQQALFDIDESVQAGHKYQAEFGEWRIDENGMPIRADLSMEAQADMTPLQRDMFVDQNGTFAKLADTGYYDKEGKLVETPTKSMQQALDELDWAHKRGALSKSGLMKGEVEASGPLKAAAMEAEGPQLTPQQRWGKQAGGLKIAEWVAEQKGDKSLKDVLPEMVSAGNTPDEVISAVKSVKDVPDRGTISQGISEFTKGLSYERFKTGGHPLIRYTFDKFSNAADTITKRIDSLIRDDLSPQLRNLSKKELSDLGEIMTEAMKLKTPVDAELLSKAGYNDKQIRVAETIQTIHQSNLEQLNKSREIVGKPPISAYQAYLAGLASGDFRRYIYTDKVTANGTIVPEIVGVVGSDFRKRTDMLTERLLAANPEWKATNERYYGMRKGKQENSKAVTEALSILSDNNPHIAKFAEEMERIMGDVGYDAFGAKKHTLGKKGIFGMEGDKPWLNDPYQNAMDMFNAQIRYTQTMSKWVANSEALSDVSKVLSDPKIREEHPNAVAMAERYIDNVMGTNKKGAWIDDFIGAVGDKVGVGPSVNRKVQQAMRNTVNTLFFSLNAPFLAVNWVQAPVVMAEIKAFMRQRGIDVTIDPTGWTDLANKGSFSAFKHAAGWEASPFEASIWKYAKEHGIDHTQLVESPLDIRSGPSYLLKKSLKLGTDVAEAGPRSVMFATMAHMLKDSGYGKDPDLFKVAKELTDIAMTDYRHLEQMPALQHLGQFGETAANLTSFKQNTLSRYALFAREMGDNNYRAFLTAALAAVTYAGVQGLPGYSELDWAVTHLSELLGKPTTLSKMTMDLADDYNGIKKGLGDAFAMGIGGYFGVDLHNRLGLSSAMPSITGGTGKLVDIGKAGVQFAKDKDEWSAKNLAREVAIPPMQPWMDINWFSYQTPEGTELNIPRQGKETIVRNDADKLFKRIGLTGSNEARKKAQDYAVYRQDKYFADKQTDVIRRLNNTVKNYKGQVPDHILNAYINQYIKVQGDPNNLGKRLEEAQVDLNTSTRMRRLMSNQTGSVSSGYKLQRSYTKE